MTADWPGDKPAQRALLKARRDALPAAQRAALAEQLAAAAAAAALGRLPAGTVVGAYWPYRSEADPRPLLRWLQQRGARLALPVVDGAAMQFRAWDGDGALVPAGFGTLGPAPTAPVVVPQLLLAPLLGFDAAGQRLGWGKGYYDRYVAAAAAAPAGAPWLCGIAFACQEAPWLAAEAHDRRLDAVATEHGLRCFGGGAVVGWRPPLA